VNETRERKEGRKEGLLAKTLPMVKTNVSRKSTRAAEEAQNKIRI
jgi:hypothetical protein